MFYGLLGFMVLLAVILALWEIQIEGADGWAAKLPAWRITKGFFFKLMGNRPVTGYHLYLSCFLIAAAHFPLFFVPWTWRLECLLIGFYIGMGLVEDFLWFVFNPHYGIKNFRKGKIWWHKTWWGPVPSLYYYLAVLTAAGLFLGHNAI